MPATDQPLDIRAALRTAARRLGTTSTPSSPASTYPSPPPASLEGDLPWPPGLSAVVQDEADPTDGAYGDFERRQTATQQADAAVEDVRILRRRRPTCGEEIGTVDDLARAAEQAGQQPGFDGGNEGQRGSTSDDAVRIDGELLDRLGRRGIGWVATLVDCWLRAEGRGLTVHTR